MGAVSRVELLSSCRVLTRFFRTSQTVKAIGFPPKSRLLTGLQIDATSSSAGTRDRVFRYVDDCGQQDLFADLPRGEQLNLLRLLKLPDVVLNDGHRIRASTLMHILYRIDDRASPRCFASHQTLASDACCDRKTIGRAIEGLVSLSVVVQTDNDEWATNEYVMDWTTIKRMVDSPKREKKKR